MRLAEAFVSPRADGLFASVAAVPDARELHAVDVPEVQREAHEAIALAIENARQRRPDPGSRMVLVKGDPGSGKTHVLTTALERALGEARPLYPVVLQLTAPVTRADYERWLLEALFRELAARHFADPLGQSPLRALARRLLDQAPPVQAEALARAVDEGEDEALLEAALACGRSLRRALADKATEDPPSEGFLAVLLLGAAGDTSAMRWLRRGQSDDRLTRLRLPPIETPHERLMVVRDLGLAVQGVDGALVVGFDQVENTVRLGSEELFVHAMIQTVRLAESVLNLAVVVAVLGPEYDRIAGGTGGVLGLPESDRYRIERERPSEVYIRTPSVRSLLQVVGQRLAVLRARSGLGSAEPSLDPLPDWFVDRLGDMRTVRFALREVNRLRERAAALGRLPTASELDGEPSTDAAPAGTEGTDFDKLWADHRDARAALPATPDERGRAERLAWWARAASEERSGAGAFRATTHGPEGGRDYHRLDIEVARSGVAERHQVALCEAPNRGGRLARQLEQLVASEQGAPIAVRTGTFPRNADSPAAAALRALRSRNGATVELTDLDWQLLEQAEQFAAAHAPDPAFLPWRRRSQWLVRLLPDHESLLPILESPAEAAPPPAPPFPLSIGIDVDTGGAVAWDPYRPAPDALSNAGFLVTGDGGTGKTQTVRLLIDAASRQGLPVFVLDFDGGYADPAFATALGLDVFDVAKHGLPFDLLEPPPPRADKGVQPVSHAFDLAAILTRALGFGPVQEGLLRNTFVTAYRRAGIDPQAMVDPSIRWPRFADVLNELRAEPKAAGILPALAAFEELGLVRPTAHEPPIGFGSFVHRRVVLLANQLPNAEIARAVAELVILQVHGHALRGEAPRQLTRLVVLDDAQRLRGSRRLEALAREGRAFGVGLVVATAIPGDLPDTLVANLATHLFLFNSQAEARTFIARRLYAGTGSTPAVALLDRLATLKPFEGLLVNGHHGPFCFVRVQPHHERTAPLADPTLVPDP